MVYETFKGRILRLRRIRCRSREPREDREYERVDWGRSEKKRTVRHQPTKNNQTLTLHPFAAAELVTLPACKDYIRHPCCKLTGVLPSSWGGVLHISSATCSSSKVRVRHVHSESESKKRIAKPEPKIGFGIPAVHISQHNLEHT